MEKLIAFFARRHLLTNFITLGVLLGAVLAWNITPKEELPNFELNIVVVSTVYPGAAPEDVELLVTKRLEEKLKGIDGVYEIRSTSTVGSSSIRIEFEAGFKDIDNAVDEIRNQISSVRLPDEVRDQPVVRQFKTSRKAVIDVGLYLDGVPLLDDTGRDKLQKFAIALENRLTSLPEVSEASSSGYLKRELQIHLIPARLRYFNVSISEIVTVLKKNNLRVPAGSLEDHLDTKLTVRGWLDDPVKLRSLIIRTGFDTPALTLGEVAVIKHGFEKNESYRKINGCEAITYQIRKTASADILNATDAVNRAVAEFNRDTLKGTGVKAILMDDESVDVRNRLSLITWNGLIGFLLIMLFLFLFMDFKTGFWVAMGIPFTFAFIMIVFPLLGYSINNITLAAVIIVMGMIVDDAIVVAENISRMEQNGMDRKTAAIKGTANVFLAVTGSIITTAVAFIPLLFFAGRFGQMVSFIPPIIIYMLFGSLIESTLVLPSHLSLHMPAKLQHRLRFFRKDPDKTKEPHWFLAVEKWYEQKLHSLLHHRLLIIICFLILLGTAGWLALNKFTFVLFPREEVTQLRIIGTMPPGTGRLTTAKSIRPIELMLDADMGINIVNYRTSIARSRRGGAADQNAFSFNVELVPKESRKSTTTEIIKKWQQKLDSFKQFDRLYIAKTRFGSSSGSAVEVVIHENNDDRRLKIARELARAMRRIPGLSNIEIDEPLQNPEYQIMLNRERLGRLGVDPSSVSTSLRTILEGTIIDELNDGDEEVDIRVSMQPQYKKSIHQVLNLPVQNNSTYLVPLASLVTAVKTKKPSAISRINHKRSTWVYADIGENNRRRRPKTPQTKPGAVQKKPGQSMQSKKTAPRTAAETNRRARRIKRTQTKPVAITPIQAAEHLETKVFPELRKKYPSASFSFTGEIKDTRESGNDIGVATGLVIFLIFMILALLFNSLTRPVIIMLTIPFGTAGIILTFWIHGIEAFGLFSAIGALGLAGVVINDSIVMISKLDEEYDSFHPEMTTNDRISAIAATRLRAVLLTTFTTVAGVMPTAYGVAGYDAMLSQMMLALSWGLLFGTLITLILVPTIYSLIKHGGRKPATAPLKGTSDEIQ